MKTNVLIYVIDSSPESEMVGLPRGWNVDVLDDKELGPEHWTPK